MYEVVEMVVILFVVVFLILFTIVVLVPLFMLNKERHLKCYYYWGNKPRIRAKEEKEKQPESKEG